MTLTGAINSLKQVITTAGPISGNGAGASLPSIYIPGQVDEKRPEDQVVKLVTGVEVKALGEGRVEALVSNESEDRDGDIIRQAGWQLDGFQRHPVLLADHNYFSIRAQIGEWENMTIRGKTLRGVARYYIGQGNPDADWAYHLATMGRAAYSVGFIPLTWERRDEGGWEFLTQELLEVSHVTVPSNRDALQLWAKSVAAVTRSIDMEKQGRVLSAANESALRGVMESLNLSAETIAAVLAQLEDADTDDGKQFDLVGVTADAIRSAIQEVMSGDATEN